MVVKLIGSLYLLLFVYICIDNLVLSVPELSFILFTHKNAISNYYSRRDMNELTKNVDNYMNQLNKSMIIHSNNDNNKIESHKLYDRFHLSYMRLMIAFDKLTKDYEMILCTGYDNSIIESFNLSLSEFDILRKETISIYTCSYIKFMDMFNKMKSNNEINDDNYLNILYGDLVLKSHAYIISMKSLYNILTLRSEECYISKNLYDEFYNMYIDVLIKLLNDSESNFHEYPFRIKNQQEFDEVKLRFNKINNNHKNALIAIDEFFSSLLSKYRKMNIQIDDEKFNKSLKIMKKIHVYSSSFNINSSLFSIIIILVTVITILINEVPNVVRKEEFSPNVMRRKFHAQRGKFFVGRKFSDEGGDAAAERSEGGSSECNEDDGSEERSELKGLFYNKELKYIYKTTKSPSSLPSSLRSSDPSSLHFVQFTSSLRSSSSITYGEMCLL